MGKVVRLKTYVNRKARQLERELAQRMVRRARGMTKHKPCGYVLIAWDEDFNRYVSCEAETVPEPFLVEFIRSGLQKALEANE